MSIAEERCCVPESADGGAVDPSSVESPGRAQPADVSAAATATAAALQNFLTSSLPSITVRS
jgi:hypothetical protein